jgi:hypothetical protein
MQTVVSKSLGKPRTIGLKTSRPPIEAPITTLSRVNLVLSFPSFLATPRAYRSACFRKPGGGKRPSPQICSFPAGRCTWR